MARPFDVSAAALSAVAITVHGLFAPAASADVLVLRPDKTFEGTFESFSADRFHFLASDGTPMHEMRIRAESLELDRPMPAVVRHRGSRSRKDLTLKGYRRPDFVFAGQSGETMTISGAQIISIEKGLSFDLPGAGRTARGGLAVAVEAVEDAVKSNTITVVHFHMPSVVASVRQGNYVGELARRSEGAVTVVTVDIPDWNCAAARKYDIRSVPQFWFYDRRACLAAKLVDRFTEEDIDRALEQAGR